MPIKNNNENIISEKIKNFTENKILIGIILFFLQFATLFSQTSTVDLIHPEKTKLEILTFKEVNKLRQNINLKDLIWDDLLYRAAKDHADYLIHENKISHSQTIHAKRTPLKRVQIHGGINYQLVGENIVSVYLGVTYQNVFPGMNTISYLTAGETMTYLWKTSTEHYNNIISEKYKYSALAVSYDSITQKLIGVQVFGFSPNTSEINNIPDYANDLINSDIPELPYNLKNYRYHKRLKKGIKDFTGFTMEDGYLTGSYKTAKKVFKGPRSGITQEFIQISDYDSNNINFIGVPNRRNGMYALNGTLTKPVYRRELLKYSRLHTKRDYLIYTKLLKIKLPPKNFIYPLQPNTNDYEYNLFYIKNQRLTYFKSYMAVPAYIFQVPFPIMEIRENFSSLKIPSRFKVYHNYDTLSLKVYYKVGETDPENIDHLGKLMNNLSGKIIDIKGSAFASIEGDSAKNEELATLRMDKFITVTDPWLNKIDFKYELITGEHWNLFYNQVNGTPLSFLRSLTHDDIRKYINEHKSDSLLTEILNAQRYMEFQLVTKTDITKPVRNYQNPEQKYDSLVSILNQTESPRKKQVKAVENAQLVYYKYLIEKGHQHDSGIIDFPELKKHPEFKYHDNLFRYSFLNELSEKELFTQLHSIGYSKHFPGKLKNNLLYNNQLILFNAYLHGNIHDFIDNISCKQLRKKEFYFTNYKNINCSFSDKNTDYHMLTELPGFIKLQQKLYQDQYTTELKRYYYLNIIKSLSYDVPFNNEINNYLSGFKKYFHPDIDILTDQEKLKLAYFYCEINKFITAKKIIKPIATRDTPNREALKLYATLTYPDYENIHDFTNYLISIYPQLGNDEWCDFWQNPSYLNSQLLDDLKLKRFYNCNCN